MNTLESSRICNIISDLILKEDSNMLIEYSKAIKYSMIENICTIFVIDNHTLSDVLKCKRDIRKLHPNVKFRKIININKEAIC